MTNRPTVVSKAPTTSTPNKKRPPLMAATRKFLLGIKLPESKTKSGITNADIQSLYMALSFFPKGTVTEDMTSMTCVASNDQLSTMMACSERTTRRRIKAARESRTLEAIVHFAHQATTFNIFQTPQPAAEQSPDESGQAKGHSDTDKSGQAKGHSQSGQAKGHSQTDQSGQRTGPERSKNSPERSKNNPERPKNTFRVAKPKAASGTTYSGEDLSGQNPSGASPTGAPSGDEHVCDSGMPGDGQTGGWIPETSGLPAELPPLPIGKKWVFIKDEWLQKDETSEEIADRMGLC